MTGKILTLKGVRLAFTDNLFTAGTYQNGPGKKKYKAKFLIPKTDPQVKVVTDELLRLAQEEWKEKGIGILSSIKGTQKLAFCDGDLKSYEGFPGNWYLNASNERKPLYVHRNPGTKENPNIITAESGVLYSGCYVNAQVSFWTWQKSGGNQINCNLLGIQFVRDGEAFSGGGVSSVDEFGNEEEGTTTLADPDAIFK